MRLTKDVLERLLRQNEGFTWETYYEGKNFRESRVYRITDGVLRVRSRGKTSWADSRFDDEFVVPSDSARRLVRTVLDRLNTEGLE